MILKAELDALRAHSPQQDNELHYTIGGVIEQQVHADIETERIKKINNGDNRLQDELEKLRHDYAFSSLKGLSKAQFNNKTREQEP